MNPELSSEFDQIENLKPKMPKLPTRPMQVNAVEEPTTSASIGSDMLDGEATNLPIPEKFQKRVGSNEVENPDAEYLDIFNLTAEQKEKLAANIKKSGGTIRVFVHTYYALNDLFADFQIVDQERIDTILDKILSKSVEDRPPVIFLEEYCNIKTLYEYIKGFNRDTVYVAPTFWGTAQPYPENDSVCQQVSESLQCDNWLMLTNLLKELGVEKILIGGQYFLNEPDRDGGEYGRCVGGAINNLEVDFDVKLSSASNNTRSELPKETRKKI
ncbi:MAG: hypothetical protein NTW79_02130 [Candidatus Berkelbacteria bacterium]|nr:hypothetical protein [Candidatus Berkelbacteria bacterium]